LDQRLSLITLGVRNVSRAQAFYEALGWHLDGGVDDETDHVAFFQAGGLIVALWDRGKLARDSGVTDMGGWGGVTLAYNVRSPEEVDAVLAEAREAGATIARSGAATFWGGYSGVFAEVRRFVLWREPDKTRAPICSPAILGGAPEDALDESDVAGPRPVPGHGPDPHNMRSAPRLRQASARRASSDTCGF
jgi:catechol 2,3-dioxygenase-like lactoylglutathione lyase family enzyme